MQQRTADDDVMKQLLTTLEANTKALQEVKGKQPHEKQAVATEVGAEQAQQRGVRPPAAAAAGLTAAQVEATLAAMGSQVEVHQGMGEEEFVEHVTEVLLKTKAAKNLRTYMGRARPKVPDQKFRRDRATQLWSHVRGL